MKKTLCAYMAGVLDSDGFMSIRRQTPNRKFPESATYSEFIGVGQTTPEAVELFRDIFGGTIKVRKRSNASWKPIHYWVVTNRIASACVKVLRPYLRVKAKQADLILALRKSKSLSFNKTRVVETGSNGGRGRSIDPLIQKDRARICAEIRSLNDTRQRR